MQFRYAAPFAMRKFSKRRPASCQTNYVHTQMKAVIYSAYPATTAVYIPNVTLRDSHVPQLRSTNRLRAALMTKEEAEFILWVGAILYVHFYR